MAETGEKSLRELVAKVGRYPEDAYHFVREGLGYAVHRVHGPESAAQITVMKYLVQKNLDLVDLRELYEKGELSKTVVAAIDDAGGFESLNRHVSGSDLCWGLRDYALQRWGRMTRSVLAGWNITETVDFGNIVFAMIEFEFMQKQPSDSLEDFRNVFDFAEAFDGYDIPFDG
ncbi:MAG: hypothetical protein H6817_01705 [Phycisphaerales bacterium]|nr:hypothetical protein [Phycisphaerales bacterium]